MSNKYRPKYKMDFLLMNIYCNFKYTTKMSFSRTQNLRYYEFSQEMVKKTPTEKDALAAGSQNTGFGLKIGLCFAHP